MQRGKSQNNCWISQGEGNPLTCDGTDSRQLLDDLNTDGQPDSSSEVVCQCWGVGVSQ